ncbi:MAG: DUF58 domain-containing protein [Lachnospira sp.]|nr:DUF58 domain-containing protein [Lachnospira sp.]
MKRRISFKGIINYIFALIFATVFGLFLDANVGWFILLTLILAPMLSVFLAWLSSRMVEITAEVDNTLMSKGDKGTMTVTVRNKSIFPTPPIYIDLKARDGFYPEGAIFGFLRTMDGNSVKVKYDLDELLISVMPRTSKTFEVGYTAKICGKAKVHVQDARVTDYLGLFFFGINIDGDSQRGDVAIIPDVSQISARDEAVIKVMQTLLHMEDSEDTVESANYTFGGFPGYDSREYVPGDPLKRINWKQSAKRDKLLVRLDDEMSSKTVNVVLDSYFDEEAVDMYEIAPLPQYRELNETEIMVTLEQDAIENALGVTRVFLRNNYTVNFYAAKCRKGVAQFVKYEIADERDMENLRIELAKYTYSDRYGVDRLPSGDEDFKDRVGLYCTPNSYEAAQAILQNDSRAFYTTVYSAVEEAKKLMGHGGITYNEKVKEAEEKKNLTQRVVEAVRPLVIPYFLSLLLSIVVFSAFDVPVMSAWTVAQVIVCAGAIILGEYVRKHKLIGSFILVALIVVLLNMSTALMFANGYMSYMRWFVSAGDYVDNNVGYLMTLLMIFTVFFALTTYYFTRILYRTSYVMLISLIPLILYVKVMKPIDMTQVVFITVLNVAAFLIDIRTVHDKGKKIIGYMTGLLSLGLYALMFIMVGLSVPEAKTPYYHIFENTFLGGNATEPIPEDYSSLNFYSGNADGYNMSDNRKLYTVIGWDSYEPLYLKRQTFDIYDFENNRWYGKSAYSDPKYRQDGWLTYYGTRNLAELMLAMKEAEAFDPGILEKYGIKDIPDTETVKRRLEISATNYASGSYIVPPNTISVKVSVPITEQDNIWVSYSDVFTPKKGLVSKESVYIVEYYDESTVINQWRQCGGADLDIDTLITMLEEVGLTLKLREEYTYDETINEIINEAYIAGNYQEDCSNNTSLIPVKVRQLAEQITKNCTNDWEKAVALQEYFENNGFVYDLSYDAPDDSVEYFLFQGKTGTCSDYASAYVLMARSIGLVVRYAEGYVPDEELSGEYVIRSNCGHAYPEVYIPGAGFVIFEATRAAVYETEEEQVSGVTGYFVYVGLRIFIVFGLVSVICVVVLLMYKIFAPLVREARFKNAVRKATPQRSVVMYYTRIRDTYLKGKTDNASADTPCEYAKRFEKLTGFDISELTYMVESALYTKTGTETVDKARAESIYKGAKAAVKKWKKERKKRRRSVYDRKFSK